MKQLLTLLATVLLLTMVGACDSFVEEVDLPIDSIADETLNDESQVNFLITGIQSRFSTSWDRVAVFAGGVSDELFLKLARCRIKLFLVELYVTPSHSGYEVWKRHFAAAPAYTICSNPKKMAGKLCLILPT